MTLLLAKVTWVAKPYTQLAIVADAFDNQLTLVDFSKGFYTLDKSRNVTGVSKYAQSNRVLATEGVE